MGQAQPIIREPIKPQVNRRILSCIHEVSELNHCLQLTTLLDQLNFNFDNTSQIISNITLNPLTFDPQVSRIQQLELTIKWQSQVDELTTLQKQKSSQLLQGQQPSTIILLKQDREQILQQELLEQQQMKYSHSQSHSSQQSQQQQYEQTQKSPKAIHSNSQQPLQQPQQQQYYQQIYQQQQMYRHQSTEKQQLPHKHVYPSQEQQPHLKQQPKQKQQQPPQPQPQQPYLQQPQLQLQPPQLPLHTQPLHSQPLESQPLYNYAPHTNDSFGSNNQGINQHNTTEENFTDISSSTVQSIKKDFDDLKQIDDQQQQQSYVYNDQNWKDNSSNSFLDITGKIIFDQPYTPQQIQQKFKQTIQIQQKPFKKPQQKQHTPHMINRPIQKPNISNTPNTPITPKTPMTPNALISNYIGHYKSNKSPPTKIQCSSPKSPTIQQINKSPQTETMRDKFNRLLKEQQTDSKPKRNSLKYFNYKVIKPTPQQPQPQQPQPTKQHQKQRQQIHSPQPVRMSNLQDARQLFHQAKPNAQMQMNSLAYKIEQLQQDNKKLDQHGEAIVMSVKADVQNLTRVMQQHISPSVRADGDQPTQRGKWKTLTVNDLQDFNERQSIDVDNLSSYRGSIK